LAIEDLQNKLGRGSEELSRSEQVQQGLREELGELKARLTLDLLEFSVSIVADRPDLLEDNQDLVKENSKHLRELAKKQDENDGLKRRMEESLAHQKQREKLVELQQRQLKATQHKVQALHQKEKQLQESLQQAAASVAKMKKEAEGKIDLMASVVGKNSTLA